MADSPDIYGSNPWEDLDDTEFMDSSFDADQLMTPERQPGESEESKLRPVNLREYYGQDKSVTI